MIAATFRRGGLHLFAAGILQAMAGLLAQLVLMRYLAPADFGAFAVTMAAVSLTQSLVSLRLVPAIMRASEAEFTPGLATRFYSGLCWEAVIGLGAALVWLIGWGPEGLWPLVLLAALCLGNWLGQVVVFYERTMPYRRLAKVETGIQFTGHAIAVALVLAGVGAASLYLRELAVVVVKLVLFMRLDMLPRLKWRWLRWGEWRALVSETRGLYLESTLEGVFQRVVVLICDTIVGIHGTGIFAQAQRLAGVPHQFLSPLTVRYGANWFSREEEPHRRRRALGQLLALAAVPLVAAAVALVALADPVVPLLFGDQWRPAVPVLIAMVGMVLFGNLFEIARAYCMVVRATTGLVLVRVTQLSLFGAFALAAQQASEPLVVLSWGVSAAMAAAFALALAAALRTKRRG